MSEPCRICAHAGSRDDPCSLDAHVPLEQERRTAADAHASSAASGAHCPWCGRDGYAKARSAAFRCECGGCRDARAEAARAELGRK